MIPIYLIERTVLDSSENSHESAIRKVPYAYVFTMRKAEKIRKQSKILTHNDCWAIPKSGRLYEYTWTYLEHYKNEK